MPGILRPSWYANHKDDIAEYYKEYRDNIKQYTINAYGGKCVECGESDFIVLVLDHINDDAQQDRLENNHKGGFKLYQYLRRNGYPKGRYQVLCHNCNFRKEYWRRKNAKQISEASKNNGCGGALPEICEEGRNPTEGG